MRQWLQAFWLGLLLLFAAVPLQAVAQTTEPPKVEQQKIDPRKLLVPRKNADGTIKITSFTESPVRWLAEKQREYTIAMATALRQAKNSSSAAAAWTLILLSFAYGVLHAAGPGHGKTVVSAWLLATENELKRGIIIAFISSMIQAATAVVLVGGALLLVAGAASTARQLAGIMESASYAMIAALGFYLIWTAFQRVMRRQPAALGVVVSGNSGEATASSPDFSSFQPAANGHVHKTAAEHANCAECGHAHAPSAAEVRGQWSWQRAIAMSFAIGIRPCTGAIVILLLAYSIGMFATGVAATFAMGFGTFLTVALIAALSVYARKFALILASRNNRAALALSLTLRFAGGVAIVMFGAMMFAASITGTTGSL